MEKVYVFGYSEGGIIQTLRASTNYGHLLSLMYLRAERDSFDNEKDDAKIHTADGIEVHSYQSDLEFMDFNDEFSDLPFYKGADNTLLVYQEPNNSFGYITVSNENWKPIYTLSGTGYKKRKDAICAIRELMKTNRIERIEVIPSNDDIY
ncbi:hypothetical protein [Priestia aryabhattai]